MIQEHPSVQLTQLFEVDSILSGCVDENKNRHNKA
jgi:hypothetical protein